MWGSVAIWLGVAMMARPAFAAPPQREGIGLAALVPAEVDVARPEHAPVPIEIPVRGPFRLVGASHGVRSYEAPLPIRPRSLFFERAPEGMDVYRGSTRLRHSNLAEDADRAGTWSYSQHGVVVRLRAETARPSDGEFTVRYAAAREREEGLWRATSSAKDDRAFVVRSVQVEDVTREGVYLPAPSRIAWDVDVPDDGMLAFDVGIVPPEVADGTASDGADVQVLVDGQAVDTIRVDPDGFAPVRVDLSAFAGKRVRLALATSDDDSRRDHVFLAAPAVYAPKPAPRRVVLVFVDTLRRDHLGVYGYGRATTPQLDTWAKDAVVFDTARSVAPWTLPSARTVLSGRQPERWDIAPTLPERLTRHGWATGAFVGNVYLSSNFDMAGGWGEHGCVNWPSADVEVRRARAFLDRNADRDALLMVHFMDMHLPYKEPSRYRGLFAGKAPGGLGEIFGRSDILTVPAELHDALRTYLVDRYDQNLRYVDDSLAALLDEVGDDAIVVVFADHGEEFWDHGDFEHGHTLYDELLRVPLLVRAPGLAARRVNTPVSLLDVTPTVLDLLGEAVDGLDGRSLLNLARTGRDDTLAQRPIGFGRVLYGNEAWGSVHDGRKYTTRSGTEAVHDLRSDAAEKVNLRLDGADPAPGRAALAAGVGRDVHPVWRLTVAEKEAGGPYTAELFVPGGIAKAWVGDDPAKRSSAELDQLDDTHIRVKFSASRGAFREIFVLPVGDPVTAAEGATLRGRGPDTPLAVRPFDGTTTELARSPVGRNQLVVTHAVMPLPADASVSAEDDELRGALEAMGYLDAPAEK